MSKKTNREAYIALSEEVNFLICSFCKYGEFNCGSGNSCNHSLANRTGFPEDLEPGSDCWGFRPSLSVELTADIVGIMLQKGWSFVSWWKDGDQLKVSGMKER